MISRNPLRTAADAERIRLMREPRISVGDCVHPHGASRFDGLFVAAGEVHALMTCDPDLGGCGGSFCRPVREDVREKALRDRADSLHDPTVPRTAWEIPTRSVANG